MVKILRQAGAIPYQHQPDGFRILLITSRETGRWVIPKGNVEPGQTARQAAEREAFEEAGLKGATQKTPIGIYTYAKRPGIGPPRPATVEVFALHVLKQLKKFPERGQRRLEWMPPEIAADLVDEPGLKLLLLRLAQIEAGTEIEKTNN
jgi:8-oxo-dGTP pyrophosphatase MutT (NUDIX family)